MFGTMHFEFKCIIVGRFFLKGPLEITCWTEKCSLQKNIESQVIKKMDFNLGCPERKQKCPISDGISFPYLNQIRNPNDSQT